MSNPRRIVPPGSTPLRELAHAIAGALTLPKTSPIVRKSGTYDAATGLLGQPGVSDEAAEAPEMIP